MCDYVDKGLGEAADEQRNVLMKHLLVLRRSHIHEVSHVMRQIQLM